MNFIDNVVRDYQLVGGIQGVACTSSPEEQIRTDPPLTEDEDQMSYKVIPEDTELTEDQDSGGPGSLPCTNLTLPLVILAAGMIVKHDHWI